MKKIFIILFFSTLLSKGYISATPQEQLVLTLPAVEVDTAAYPALRILRQLHKHENKDEFMRAVSFNVLTEGDYTYEFDASKFIRGYMKGAMSVMGFPRLAKIFIKNNLVTHKIHALHSCNQGKYKEVEVRLDSANLELTPKQYKLIKRSNLDIDRFVTKQFNHPKNPWGSKKYEDYLWQLVDTTTMYGHRVDILEFSSKPKKGLMSHMIGGSYGRICIIEDYWKLIDVEWKCVKNNSMFQTHLEPIAQGVFRPTEVVCTDDYSMNIDDFLEIQKINPDSLDEKKRNKLEKVIDKVNISLCETYRLRFTYRDIAIKDID